uniref:Uncharacterized protein n=1 Tax=Oryza rufipogon TaxID=4529 RepID=A0A0E0R0S7_ORYRU
MAAHRQHLQSQLWRLVDTAYGIKKFDPERRGRRVVSYKAYSVEGKIKASRACVQVKEVGKNASEERLIVVSSQEIPDDPVSPTIEALILLRNGLGAEIPVYSKADKPKYLSFDEELVQVAGLPAIARGALTEIASRL